MPIVKEVTVVTRYTNSQGEEKKRYHNVGAIISTRNGDMLKLESLPIGWDGWAYLNDPKEREEKPAAPAKSARKPNQGSSSAPMAPPPADDFDDPSIPF